MKRIIICFLLFYFTQNVSGQGVYHVWGQLETTAPYGASGIYNMGWEANNFSLRYYATPINPGFAPNSPLVEYNGKYYNTTNNGGTNNNGVIFEYDSLTNTYQVKVELGLFGLRNPVGKLQLYGGKLYGTTAGGGQFSSGCIYEYDPVTNNFSIRYNFPAQGAGFIGFPTGLNLHSNGKFYTGGSAFFTSTSYLIEWDPNTGIAVNKLTLAAASGTEPCPYWVEYNGIFYGTTNAGGTNSLGVLFTWDPVSNIYTKKIDFNAGTGMYKANGMALYNGKLYGLQAYGGTTNNGVFFEWDILNNTYTVNKNFDFSTGITPDGCPIVYNGIIYGALNNGGGNGSFFAWDPTLNTFTIKFVIPNFTDGNANGVFFLIGSGGNLYSCSRSGGNGYIYGNNSRGVIFNWNPNTNIHTKKIDFSMPPANGLLGTRGLIPVGRKFYGITKKGGTNAAGIIYEFDPATNAMTPKVNLGDFGCIEPYGTLVLYNNKYYGITNQGAGGLNGTIFEWDPVTNIFIKKINLNYNTNGGAASGGLTLCNNKFYTACRGGGSAGSGTMLEWDPATNILTTKLNFSIANGNAQPQGKLIAFGNKLYGYNRNDGKGNLFEYDPATNTFITKKANLNSTPVNGYALFDGMIVWNGKLYGVMSVGGVNTGGVLFEWEPVSNVYTIKYNFFPFTGYSPNSAIALVNNKFYGTTQLGSGSNNFGGVLYEFDPTTNVYTVKRNFSSANQLSADYINTFVSLPSPVADGTFGSCVTFPSITINASNNNKWVPILDNAGNAVAEIKANGNNLGLVTASAYINSGTLREDGTKRLYLDRNITITPQQQPTTSVDIRFYIKGSEFDALKNGFNSLGTPSGINSINDIAIFKSVDPCSPAVTYLANNQVTTASVWNGTDYVLSSSINSFSSFYFSNKLYLILPVSLIDFSAQLKNNGVQLNWHVNNDVDVTGYVIERSGDGVNFSPIATVQSKKNAGTSAYSYLDGPLSGLSGKQIYYRLKIVNLGNSAQYSNTAMVRMTGETGNISIFPNPVSDKLNLVLPAALQGKMIQYSIFNSMGQLVSTGKIASVVTGGYTIDVKNLSKGLYCLRLNSDTETIPAVFKKL